MAKKKQPIAPSKRSPRGERTRARLVAAARIVFEKDGFAPARIVDIAKKARIAIGSFYTYFQTKEEILRAVVDLVDAELSAPLPADVGTDQLARIEAGTRAYVQRFKQNARILAVLQHRTVEDPELYTIRRRSLDRWIARAERSIRRLQAEGHVPKALSPRFAATVVTGMVHSFCYETYAFGTTSDLDDDQVSKGLAEMWARAIGLDVTAPQRAHEARRAHAGGH